MWAWSLLKFSIILIEFGQLRHVESNLQLLDGRIVGGKSVNISEFPYQVSLQDKSGHICGGSILRSLYILTAAHCVDGKPPKTLYIRAGSRFTEKEGIVRTISSIVVHANYSRQSYNNDIAILKLHENLIFGPNILPIALPTSRDVVTDNSSGFVTGYGVEREGSGRTTSLKKIMVKIINVQVCKERYKTEGPITNRMLCAGCGVGICDSCQGDSGGPLAVNGKLAGIVSWGQGCARPEYPGVYTKVSQFRKWILAIIGR